MSVGQTPSRRSLNPRQPRCTHDSHAVFMPRPPNDNDLQRPHTKPASRPDSDQSIIFASVRTHAVPSQLGEPHLIEPLRSSANRLTHPAFLSCAVRHMRSVTTGQSLPADGCLQMPACTCREIYWVSEQKIISNAIPRHVRGECLPRTILFASGPEYSHSPDLDKTHASTFYKNIANRYKMIFALI